MVSKQSEAPQSGLVSKCNGAYLQRHTPDGPTGNLDWKVQEVQRTTLKLQIVQLHLASEVKILCIKIL